jgi:hypothetical protein
VLADLTLLALKFAVEAKGYDVRCDRASNLFEGLCIKYQQERAATLTVEGHGDDHAFKSIRTIWSL